MYFIWLLIVALGIATLYAVNGWKSKQSRGPLPPGPAPLPIVGNIRDLPPKGTQDWVHWLKHKALYGPISSITVMGQTIVIVNDAKIATDLLTKRSSVHSSRPKMIFASEMVGWEDGLAFQGYTERFRAYRKAIQPSFGSESAVAQFNPLQEVETRRFLFRVLKSPENLAQHIQTETGAVILNIAYGYRVEPFKRDHLVHIANVALDQFAKAATPGAWLVDVIPILRYVPSWLPGAGFKRIAKSWRDNLAGLADRPYAFVKAQVDGGQYKPSYLANIFHARIPAKGSEEETVAKWTAASLYTGGADTTVSSIECFFLAMALFPDVQRKAQEELDRVLGPDHLPKIADRPHLPYIEAIVKEALRWHPVAPMAIPHASIADDTWGQYFIPKGSLVMPNVWAMTHDPDVYPDPMIFRPERFLGESPAPDPRALVFGFGRRICPGRFLADNTVFLTVAQSLTVFDISKATRDGVEVIIPHFEPGVISHPAPFQCEVKARGPAQEALVLSVEREHPWEESDAAELEKIRY